VKTLLALVTTAAITLAFAASVQAATPRERALVRQVKTLKAQNAKLTSERNSARAQLATAQQGTAQTVSTMSPSQITQTLFPTVYNVFEAWDDGFDDGDLWTSNYTSHSVDGDGDDSWSYSFSLYES
jgi:hypothetical protein